MKLASNVKVKKGLFALGWIGGMGKKFDSWASKSYNPAMSDKISVLVVEDNETMVGAMMYHFDKDFNCVFASNVSDARLYINTGFVPEVALVDWRLKPEDSPKNIERETHGKSESFDLIKFIQEDTKGRCRVILTSSIFPDRAKRVFDVSEAWGYFTKGSDLRSLKKVFDLGFLKDGEIGQPMIFLPFVDPSIKRERE